MENKTKKTDRIYSPMKMTEALHELGESYTRKEAALYYIALLLIAFILGLLFELKPIYLLIVGVVYLLFVPQFLYNQKRQAYELKRFDDVNMYMSQMAQSFTSTEQILSSLYETMDVFTEGRMKEAIRKAVEKIETDIYDIKVAEKDALLGIEELYGCEKLHNLHEFLLMAEGRGGECDTEFTILENVRMAWEKAVFSYRNTLVMHRNISVGSFGFLLGLCIFIMNAFPENMNIIKLEMIQIIDTVMLVFLIVLFIVMDMKVNKSLLTDPKVMTKEEVDQNFSYLQGVYSEKERKKYIVYPIVAAILAAYFYIENPTAVTLAVGIVLVIIACNIRKIILTSVVSTLRNEIMKAFPKWLFDIMLLMQRQSVDSAIIKSAKNAPPVLQSELMRISNILMRVNSDGEQLTEYDENMIADAYMSFMADFNIRSIKTAMGKLYSLSVGTGGSGDVMKFIIENNMELLTEAEKNSIELKGDVSSLAQYIPAVVMTFTMIVYCVALIVVSFSEISGMLQ